MPKGSWREFDDSGSKPVQCTTSSNETKSKLQVRVERVKSGKRGKTVTVVKGLQLETDEMRGLLKSLKSKCSTGGTLKADTLELQGDQTQIVMEQLALKGYSPKQSGG